MRIRVLAAGKRVVKTRGDQAPDVMTRRAHGTFGELALRHYEV
jgi:hypothetical protein